MDVLDRLLLREFIVYFILVLGGLALLYLSIDFLSKFWDMQMPMTTVLALYGYKVPGALNQFVPVACLMATLLVLTTMSRQNEVLALYASGIGTYRIISTFIAVTATISTFSFLTFDSLVPAFAKREMLVSKGLDPSQEYMLTTTGGGFWYRSGRLVYSVGRFIPEANSLEEVRIYLLSPSFRLLQLMHSKRAKFVNNDWVLEDGFIVAYPDSGYPISTKFTHKSGVIPEKPSDFKTLKIEDKTMRLKDLRKYIDRNKSYGLETTSEQVSYHERLALVFTPLIFVLLGIPFATKPLRTHSIAKSVGFCFLIVFLYLLIFRMSISIGKGGHIPPILAGWATNIIFFVLSLFFITRR